MQKLFENFRSYLNEEKSISDKELEELKTIKNELNAASKMHKSQSERIESIIKDLIEEELEAVLNEKIKGADGKACWKGYRYAGTENGKDKCVKVNEEEFYEVDAADVNEEYCPVCREAQALEEKKKKKKACKPSKGKRFAKRVDGKCRSFGQKGQAKGGGDRIRPGTAKGDAYCARSAGIKKCKNPPCANTLSRKKWRCRGKKSMKA
jgi:hypothetical protein